MHIWICRWCMTSLYRKVRRALVVLYRLFGGTTFTHSYRITIFVPNLNIAMLQICTLSEFWTLLSPIYALAKPHHELYKEFWFAKVAGDRWCWIQALWLQPGLSSWPLASMTMIITSLMMAQTTMKATPIVFIAARFEEDGEINFSQQDMVTYARL